MPKRPTTYKPRRKAGGVDLSELKQEDFGPVTPATLGAKLKKLAATKRGNKAK
jgi:hypothetical protein